jgi:hypothetical protein
MIIKMPIETKYLRDLYMKIDLIIVSEERPMCFQMLLISLDCPCFLLLNVIGISCILRPWYIA